MVGFLGGRPSAPEFDSPAPRSSLSSSLSVMGHLGRRVPTDFAHVERYPVRGVLARTPTAVERTLRLPAWHWSHDQGREGKCVGMGCSLMMSLLNRRRYDPTWLWNESKLIDEWADTNPGDDNGTSVRAACDVLRNVGHRRVLGAKTHDPAVSEGIAENRWATTVDEIRAALAAKIPVVIGVNWYANFDSPAKEGAAWVIGKGDLGPVRGGHAVCLYGASDRRQMVKLKNSWGRGYPLVYLPYETLARLLAEDGEATLVTDRP